MSGDLDKLERRVEREMGLLRVLPLITPDSECLARLQAAVVAESRRVARRHRTWSAGRAWIGAAAALLLVVGWATTSTRLPGPALTDPETLLSDWAAALEESSSRLASLLDNGWTLGDLGNGSDDDTELDDLFRSLDESFDRFEAL